MLRKRTITRIKNIIISTLLASFLLNTVSYAEINSSQMNSIIGKINAINDTVINTGNLDIEEVDVSHTLNGDNWIAFYKNFIRELGGIKISYSFTDNIPCFINKTEIASDSWNFEETELKTKKSYVDVNFDKWENCKTISEWLEDRSNLQNLTDELGVEFEGSDNLEVWLSKNEENCKSAGILIEPITFDYDSAVTFYKTDGKTRILFAAYPNSLSLTLTNVHFDKIQTQKLSKEFNSLITGRKGPNYDEKNKVTSIAGVRFGETRTNTINAFKQRGTFLKNENNITYFSNVNFGGSTYSIAKFYFEYDKRRYENVLAAAKFEKNFYEWRREEAVMMYEAVTSSFSSKYTNGTIIKDEEDQKMIVFGMLSDDYADGKIPPIIVSLDLGISRGGDKFYYVSVSYFVQRMSSVDSDDL